MGNRIRRIHIQNGRLDPVEAEVWLDVYPDHLTATTQVRGRLVGPRCPYSSTVQVAYPFQELAQEGTHRRVRAVIPEPCWWDPESPFLYEGVVELWEAGQRCDQVQTRHGLYRCNLGPHGLRWNGRLLPLRGVACSNCQPNEAVQLHQAGSNLLLVPVAASNAVVGQVADQFGLLVLGQVHDRHELTEGLTRSRHVSCLGWVLAAELLHDPDLTGQVLHDLAADGRLRGVELRHKPAEPLPDWVQFLACDENQLTTLVDISLPKLVLKKSILPQGLGSKETVGPGQILGWIRESSGTE